MTIRRRLASGFAVCALMGLAGCSVFGGGSTGFSVTPSTVRCAGETRTMRMEVPAGVDRWTRIRLVLTDLDAGSELASDTGDLGDLFQEFSADGRIAFTTTSSSAALECRLPNGHYGIAIRDASTDALLASGDFRVAR